MRVVPIGTALQQGILVDEDSLRRNRKCRDIRNAIHARRHQQTVPMYRCRICGKRVLNLNAQYRAFAHPDLGAGVLPIDHNTWDAATAIRVECCRTYSKAVLGCAWSWHVVTL